MDALGVTSIIAFQTIMMMLSSIMILLVFPLIFMGFTCNQCHKAGRKYLMTTGLSEMMANFFNKIR
jgi:hypothetical protein